MRLFVCFVFTLTPENAMSSERPPPNRPKMLVAWVTLLGGFLTANAVTYVMNPGSGTDGQISVGFPWEFWIGGGFSGRSQIHLGWLLANLLLAVAVSLILLRPVVRWIDDIPLATPRFHLRTILLAGTGYGIGLAVAVSLPERAAWLLFAILDLGPTLSLLAVWLLGQRADRSTQVGTFLVFLAVLFAGKILLPAEPWQTPAQHVMAMFALWIPQLWLIWVMLLFGHHARWRPYVRKSQ